MYPNADLRNAMRKARFKNYEIARKLGVPETSFSRMLRYELDADKSAKIYQAISELIAESGC